MIRLRQILCPVDLSEFSARALRHALALGRSFDAEVIALAVRPREPAAAFVKAASDSVRLVETEGEVVPDILSLAADLPADLIVMGTHGWSGFNRLLLGSVTETVLQRAECPVLTVSPLSNEPSAAASSPFTTVLCGVDRSLASRRAFDYAAFFAQRAGGRLLVVHALESLAAEDPRFAGHFDTIECWRAIEPEIRASYEALVPSDVRERCTVEIHTPRGKAHRVLADLATESAADLVVVGAGGWQAPIGATAHRLLREATCPVLVVPAEQTAGARALGLFAQAR